MSINNNPFNYNLPTEPKNLVGIARWQLIKEIANDLSDSPNANSWALIGGKRFGKTSLLNTLQWQLSQPTAEHNRYVVAFKIDLKIVNRLSEQNVYWRILLEIYRFYRHKEEDSSSTSITLLRKCTEFLRKYTENVDEKCPFVLFEQVLEQLLNNIVEIKGATRLIFMLDEVEKVLDTHWGKTLFDQLRYVINDGRLSDNIKLILTGSTRIIKAKQEGSPLLNAVIVKYLQSLCEEDIECLISGINIISRETKLTVQNQSGGHPFIAQYILHYLWKESTYPISTKTVNNPIYNMHREIGLHKEFAVWWESVGNNGQLVYELLTYDWQSEKKLIKLIIDKFPSIEWPAEVLYTLCCHGLVRCDEHTRQYRISGELFHNWVLENKPKKQEGKSIIGSSLNKLKTINWLHLSDIHLSDKNTDTYEMDKVIDALLTTLEENKKDGNCPDIIFFTGDISDKGCDYSNAVVFFDKLLDVSGLISRYGENAKRHLFIVPGNHDVDRAKTNFLSRPLTKRQQANDFFGPHNSTARQIYFNRFHAYLDFFNDYFKNIRQLNVNQHYYAELLNLQHGCIGVIGLNSAWFCQDDEDEAKLWIGERVCDEAFNIIEKAGQAEIIFTLQHHPFDWLHPQESSTIRGRLTEKANICLFGHMHESDAEQIHNQHGNILKFQSGAVYDKSQYPSRNNWPYRILCGSVSLETSKVYIRPMTYQDGPPRRWTIDPSMFPDKKDYIGEFSLSLRGTSTR